MADRRTFGRDGVTGLVTPDRAMRAREISRPTPEQAAAARDAVADVLARALGHPRRR